MRLLSCLRLSALFAIIGFIAGILGVKIKCHRRR